MKVNSETLYELINDGTIHENIKLKVYRDDCYVTLIGYDGYDFKWDAGTFTSGMFYDPLVEFEIIEEEKTPQETIKQIAKMIASGEIPKDVYDKYLGKCPIGFMNEEDLFDYLFEVEQLEPIEEKEIEELDLKYDIENNDIYNFKRQILMYCDNLQYKINELVREVNKLKKEVNR